MNYRIIYVIREKFYMKTNYYIVIGNFKETKSSFITRYENAPFILGNLLRRKSILVL